MSKKSKQVLILRSNPIDPDPRVEKEADSLLKAGYKVDVFCWDRGSYHAVECKEKVLNNGSCDVYRVGIASSFGSGFKKNLKPLLKFQLEIIRFLKTNRDRYDVIHSCDFDTALAGFIGRSVRNRFVYDIFDYYADAFAVPSFLKKLVVMLDTYVIDRADAVIICSEQRKVQLGKAKPKRLAVIHNSPPSWREKKKAERDGSRLRIAYIGILSDDRLIPELLEIVSRHPGYELHIAGFGKYESLAREYSDKCNNINFFGRTDYSRTLEIENECDVMIATYNPSVANHRYAAPNKFYEALMLGKPLVMCRGTGFSDVVEENGIGVCIEYSEKDLEDGLELINNEYDRFSGKESFEKELYNKKYSWDIMDERLTELYSSFS